MRKNSRRAALGIELLVRRPFPGALGLGCGQTKNDPSHRLPPDRSLTIPALSKPSLSTAIFLYISFFLCRYVYTR